MSCNHIEGLALYCADGVSGAKKAWVTEFASVTAYTESSGTITTITQASGTKFWEINVMPDNMALVENNTGTLNTTRKSEQILTFTINKPTAKLRNWIKINVQNRFIVIVETLNGDYKIVGLTRGAYNESTNTTTGKEQGEFNGSTFTFKANEPQDCFYVSSSVMSGLSTGV